MTAPPGDNVRRAAGATATADLARGRKVMLAVYTIGKNGIVEAVALAGGAAVRC